jgi:ABC-type branched-subunit amino acid transport system substrate-binding protein
MKSYIEQYKSTYGFDASYWDAIGYDSCILIAEALKRVGSDLNSQSLFDALYNMDNIALVLGDSAFNNSLDANLQMVMRQIQNGVVESINN